MIRFPGVVTGIVKSLDDPQGQGRIQVLFPWLSDTQRSAWAPVAAPMAGPSRGQFFMPEIDDEVLVAFEHGSFEHPFILGFLWNGVDKPPETTNQNRIIKTPGGHELRFEDKDGEQKVIVKSNGGHQITLDDSSDAPSITIKTSKDHSLVLDDQAQSITVKTSQGQSLALDDQGQSIELKGGGRTLKLEGGKVQIS